MTFKRLKLQQPLFFIILSSYSIQLTISKDITDSYFNGKQETFSAKQQWDDDSNPPNMFDRVNDSPDDIVDENGGLLSRSIRNQFAFPFGFDPYRGSLTRMRVLMDKERTRHKRPVTPIVKSGPHLLQVLGLTVGAHPHMLKVNRKGRKFSITADAETVVSVDQHKPELRRIIKTMKFYMPNVNGPIDKLEENLDEVDEPFNVFLEKLTSDDQLIKTSNENTPNLEGPIKPLEENLVNIDKPSNILGEKLSIIEGPVKTWKETILNGDGPIKTSETFVGNVFNGRMINKDINIKTALPFIRKLVELASADSHNNVTHPVHNANGVHNDADEHMPPSRHVSKDARLNNDRKKITNAIMLLMGRSNKEINHNTDHNPNDDTAHDKENALQAKHTVNVMNNPTLAKQSNMDNRQPYEITHELPFNLNSEQPSDTGSVKKMRVTSRKKRRDRRNPQNNMHSLSQEDEVDENNIDENVSRGIEKLATHRSKWNTEDVLSNAKDIPQTLENTAHQGRRRRLRSVHHRVLEDSDHVVTPSHTAGHVDGQAVGHDVSGHAKGHVGGHVLGGSEKSRQTESDGKSSHRKKKLPNDDGKADGDNGVNVQARIDVKVRGDATGQMSAGYGLNDGSSKIGNATKTHHHLSAASTRALVFLSLLLLMLCLLVAVVAQASCHTPRRSSSNIALQPRATPIPSYLA